MKTLSILGIIGGSVVIAIVLLLTGFAAGMQQGYASGWAQANSDGMRRLNEYAANVAKYQRPAQPAVPALPSDYRCVGRDLVHGYRDNGVPTVVQVAHNSPLCP